MTHLKYLLCLGLLLLSGYVSGQGKTKVYYLVDTMNISRENRAVDIRRAGEVLYTFYCMCLEGKQNIVFTYLESNKAGYTPGKHPGGYLSWKKLLQLIDNDIKKFDQRYELYITEALPKRKYKTNRVYYTLSQTVQ